MIISLILKQVGVVRGIAELCIYSEADFLKFAYILVKLLDL